MNRSPTFLAGILVTLAGFVAIDTSTAAVTDDVEARIVAAVDARRDGAIDLLREVVEIDSATENLAGVEQVGAVFAREFKALGFETRWIDLRSTVGRAGHLVATRDGARGPRILLIGHLDTVLQGERFRREGAQAYGSGASDMKGGDVIIVEALRALAAASALDGRPITVIMTGDEENPGAPLDATRDPLREAARNADVVLAFEGSSAGVAAIGRRGNATWQLTTTGKQAHSSQIFRADLGDGAIFEAARILERFHRELREPYLTYNPAVIVGGTDVEFDEASHGGAAHGKDNVIPRETRVTGDLRFISAEQFEKASARMRAIVAEHLPGTGATIEVQLRYPSMTPSDANRGVLAVLDAVSSDLGDGPIVAEDPLNRGAGDISFVCNDGRKACLDGLGAAGEQEHAPGEWVDLDQMPKMTKRTALLLHRLAK